MTCSKAAILIIFCIRLYQRAFSPILTRRGVKCRFHPTCSEYAIQAIQKYGARRGLAKSLGRLRRCRPDNFESCIDLP